MRNKNILIIHLLTIALGSYSCNEAKRITALPVGSRQMILVISDSTTATSGHLYRFERKNLKGTWKKVGDMMPVSIGRNGLGAGAGLHPPADLKVLPQKAEGDGRSPAGIFSLGQVFGYPAPDRVVDLKMPYLSITATTECVDDIKSKYYNQIVAKDSIEKNNQMDWQSSEKMNAMGIFYELGITVNHNQHPIINGNGSCIFLHNWSDPIITTSGCTSMAPVNMKSIAYWLDQEKQPVLVQLTKPLYIELKFNWRLPKKFL